MKAGGDRGYRTHALHQLTTIHPPESRHFCYPNLNCPPISSPFFLLAYSSALLPQARYHRSNTSDMCPEQYEP